MLHVDLSWAAAGRAAVAVATAFWGAALALLAAFVRTCGRLPAATTSPDTPSLTVVVPCCNEEETVEPALTSLAALDYPNIQVVAVDDRSTDSTGAILDRLGCRMPALTVIHVADLPDGWLGKNNALAIGAGKAAGDWILFTDADVLFAQDSLIRAVTFAAGQGIDHLVLAPRIITTGFWERLMTSFFGLMFAIRTQPWNVSNPRSRACAGVGAFNLVRASAYRAAGGHAALPMDILDDVKLGKVLKRAGFRTVIRDGTDCVSVRWVRGLRGFVTGLEKNAFAGVEFSALLAVAACAGLLLFTWTPFAALLAGNGPRAAGLVSIALMLAGAAMVSRMAAAGPGYAIAYPAAAAVLVYVIARSAATAYRAHGIRWRGTLYPLDRLRRGAV